MAAGLSALLSHWWRKPSQLAALLLGLALATALWSGVQAINAEARNSYDRAAEVLGGTLYATLRPSEGAFIPQDVFVDLRRAGWLVSPVLDVSWRVDGTRVTVLGIDPITAPPAAQPVGFDTGGGLIPFITPPGQAFTNAETVARLANVPGLPELVAADDIPPGTLIMDIGIAQTLVGADAQISRLLLWPDQPAARTPLDQIAPSLREVAPETDNDLANLTDSFHLNLTAFGLLSFAVGLFIVHAAIGLAFEQRRPMFRTLRALGLSARALVALMAAELLTLALIAGGLGVVMGYLVAAALLPDVAATLRGLYGAPVTGSLTLAPSWWLSGVAIAVLGTGAAAAASLYRAATLPLLAPAQPRAWARASERTLRWQALAAVAFFAVAAVVYALPGLVAGFILLGAVLLGGALLLPPTFAFALSRLSRFATGPLSQWFFADTRQQLPGLSLALMALLLALAANIGVGTMVQSFRATFLGWLDQRLAAELYVTARDLEEAAELRAFLTPRADAVLPIYSAESSFRSAPVEVFGIIDHPTYRENWPLIARLPNAWDSVARGDALLISEQLANREGLAPGQPITLDGVTAQIAGVYSDYGNPIGQIIIPQRLFDALYPEADRLSHGIRIDPADRAALMQALTQRFGYGDDNMVDQETLKAFSVQIFERTFAVTAALNVLTLGVAALAMLTSLTTLATMRVPQLAPVWATGLPRRMLGGLEVLRAAVLALLTTILAIPVGLGLAWVLLAVVNVEAFGWRLPMQLFPADWLRLGALALIAAIIAAALPALRLVRMQPAQLVQVFAHER
ncbi:MAG: ABC transporter permease [Pseudomonadota bacterium]